MYGFTKKIKMLVSAKALPTGYFKGVSIYKAFVNLSYPANKSVQLWVKRELEIEGIRKNTKRMPSSMTLNFRLCTV